MSVLKGVSVVQGGGGTEINSETAEVDFGFASNSEGDIATTTVPATWVTANSKIICTPLATPTSDHDPEDYILEGITAIATNIVPGVSFDIIATSKYATWGRYNIQAIGIE